MGVKRHQQHFDVTARDGTAAALGAVEKNLGRVSNAATRMAQTFRAVIGATVLAGLTRETARAAIEGEQSQNRLTAALRATGNQVGLTRRELDDMADAMAEATQFDDDGLRNAQSQLIKFGNIQGQVFRDAMRVSADLAAFMGTDVADAAQQIGRALQSPTEGITLIERSLGKLTEEQEKNIKSLAAQGRAVEAQNAVLAILQQRLGGTAALMDTGIGKATRDTGKAWDDMLEAWGRTETVGGLVKDMLGGIRDIMKDIEGLAKNEAADPFRKFNTSMAKLHEEEDRLLAMKRSAQLRGGPAAEALTKDIDARIAALRQQASQVLAQTRAAREQEAFEASMRPAPKQGKLGGNTTDDAAAKKAAAELKAHWQERLRQEETLVKISDRGTDALEQMLSVEDDLEKVEKLRADHAAARLKEEMALLETLVEARGMGSDWAEQALSQTEELAVATGKLDGVARDLGLTFSSAFEDAIVEGREFREVLQGIEKDIARIIIRKAVTEPAANAIRDWVKGIDWGGIFGGGGQNGGFAFADGGRPPVGMPSLVGERGPELFVPDTAGTIVPNDRLGGGSGDVHITQNIHVDSRSDQASIMAAMHAAKEQAKAEIRRTIRSGSTAYSAD